MRKHAATGRLVRRGLLALASGALCLLALELLGRFAVPEPPPPPRGLLADDELGWILPPSVEMMQDGRRVTTNSLGLRGAEPETDALELQVVAVGDSSVFGFGMADHETFPANLGELLSRNGEASVLNAGVPGYTCLQSAALVARLRAHLDPDLLVVYLAHSDMRAAAIGDAWFGPPPTAPWRGTARLAGWLALRLRIATGRSGTALASYEACLDGIAAEQSTHGGRAVFAAPVGVWDVEALDWIPPWQPVGYHPAPPKEGEEGEEDENPILAYRDAMSRVAEHHGALYVDLPTAFAASGRGGANLFIDEVHPSAEGQMLIARELYGALEDAGWSGHDGER